MESSSPNHTSYAWLAYICLEVKKILSKCGMCSSVVYYCNDTIIDMNTILIIILDLINKRLAVVLYMHNKHIANMRSACKLSTT